MHACMEYSLDEDNPIPAPMFETFPFTPSVIGPAGWVVTAGHARRCFRWLTIAP